MAPILAVANLPVENPIGTQQIDFQVPVEANTLVNPVEVRYRGFSTFATAATVAPGIFAMADGTPAIQHSSDYSLVTPSNPARKGEVIVIYLTGLGAVSQPVGSGVAATGADPIAPSGCQPPFTSVGTTLYAGLTPGYVGLYQMNVQISDATPSGNAGLYVYWSQCWGWEPPENYAKSNTVTLPIQ